MEKEKEKGGKIFYGWWVTLAAGIGLFVSSGPVAFYAFGVFFKPLIQEFGWSRTEISLGLALCQLVWLGAVPLVGRLVDRLGARKVIVPSAVLFGLVMMSFYFLSASLWHFYAIFLALGVVGAGNSPVPYGGVISNWFDKQRGLALALAMVGIGLGAFIMPSLAQALIDAVGWRGAYVYLGLMVIGIIVSVVWPYLKENPQMMGLLPDGETATYAGVEKQSSQAMSSSEALRSGTFWILAGAFFLLAAGVGGCLIHLVPLLTDRGMSAQSAAFAASLLGIATLIGRVWTGYLLDRFFASYVAVCFFCGAALGVLLLWTGVVGAFAFVAAFLVGLGTGAETDLKAYLISRYFGLRAFAEIYGYTFSAYILGALMGPLLMGIAFDFTGSYRLGLVVSAMLALTAAGLMTKLGPYRVGGMETKYVAIASTSDSSGAIRPPAREG